MHTTTTAGTVTGATRPVPRWVLPQQKNTPMSTRRLCLALVALIVLCTVSLLALAELYWNTDSTNRGLLTTIQGTHLPRSDWSADPAVSLPIVPWNPVDD